MAIIGAETPELTPAPRGARLLAAMIDAATIGVPSFLYMRRAQRSADGRAQLGKLGGQWNRVIGPVRASLDQQVGSPGGWVVGLRTIDSRTGRRVALWRTLVLALARIAMGMLQRRTFGVNTPTSQAEHASFARELEAIKHAHPDDPEARNDAMMRLYRERERRVDVNLFGWRMLAGIVGSVLVNQWLRRRLAPTVVVSSRAATARITARKSAQ
jgi:hypothetical protein